MEKAGGSSISFHFITRVQRWRKVALALLILAGLALQLLIAPWRTGSGLFALAVSWVGLGLMFACLVGRTWSSLYIAGRKGQQIVQTGPYALSRNPLYLFSIMGAAGAGAQSGTVTLALICAVLTWAVFRVVVRQEEKFLLARHGAVFRDYMERVPRFLPRSFAFTRDKRLEVDPGLVIRSTSDAALFFLSEPIFDIIRHLQAAGYVTPFIFLP